MSQTSMYHKSVDFTYKTVKACSMSQNQSKETDASVKPCCVCKETRKARDECMVRSPDGEIMCKELIMAHVLCMRSYGFDVPS